MTTHRDPTHRDRPDRHRPLDDDPRRGEDPDVLPGGVAPGGGTQDITGPESAEHVNRDPDGHGDGHGDEHGDGHVDRQGDGHVPEEVALGPIDWPAWRAALVGILVAAVIALTFYLTVYGAPPSH